MDLDKLVGFLKARGFSVLSVSLPPGVGAIIDFGSMRVRMDEDQIIWMDEAVQELVDLLRG